MVVAWGGVFRLLICLCRYVLLHDQPIVQRGCVSVNPVQLISSGSCGWWQVGHCGAVNV